MKLCAKSSRERSDRGVVLSDGRTSAALWPTVAERSAERKAKCDAILGAAANLFAENGFHRTSMDEVAAALGLTKPTLYHYFKTKNDVLMAILAAATAAIETAFDSARFDAPALEALRDGLHGYVEVACENQNSTCQERRSKRGSSCEVTEVFSRVFALEIQSREASFS